MFEVLFYGTLAVLLGAPPIAYLLLRVCPKSWASRIAISAGSFLVAVILLAVAKVSFRGQAADAAALALAYFGLCFLFVLSFRVKTALARLAAVVILGSPIALGYLMATGGFLALIFVIGDLQPVHTEDAGGLSCRVTLYGNATTSEGGYVASLYERMFFLERQTFSLRYPLPKQPSTVCAEAVASYAG